MDPGQRRQKTAQTARLGFLLIGNLAALIFLLNHFFGADQLMANGSVAPSAAGEGVEGVALVAELESAGARPGLAPDALDLALSARIDGHISAALRRAEKLSKGKASAANCRVVVSVLNKSGLEVVNRDGQRALRPASNMKLVTSAAALFLLGQDGHFETRFEAAGEIRDGVLQGNLVVRAGADPLFDADANGRVEHLLAPVLQTLKNAGLRSIAGDIVLDQGTFLDPGPGPGWPSSSQYWQEHCALAAGFTANAGCLTAVVQPGAVGSLARSELRPDLGGLKRSGTVKTVAAKARLDIAVGATAAKATLRGSIPKSSRAWVQRFSHPDPVGLFGAVLVKALANAGIGLAGEVRQERNVRAGSALAVLRTPIASVLSPINADSNNAVADQLFFALGQAVEDRGTRAGGFGAVQKALAQVGVSSEGLVQVDGSGLSRDNRVAPRQLTQLLFAVENARGKVWSLFKDSLAVAGEKGSLSKRMGGTAAAGKVFAKTGWIRGTSALSGYVQQASGDLVAFSILVEYPDVSGLNTSCWKPMGDAICIELANWKAGGRKVR